MAWNIGANDVANAMGTSVGSGSLTLRQAVLVAAVLEFCGAYFFGSFVSETLQERIVRTEIFAGEPIIFVYGMLAALIGSGIWLQIATYFGLPVSTTHTIVGAIVGFGAIIGGIDGVYWDNVAFIASSWLFSPLIGGLIAFFLFNILRKNIFYVSQPLLAAKRLTPYLAFAVTTTLALALISEGLSNANIHLSYWEDIVYSVLVGLVGAALGYYFVNKKVTLQPKLVPVPVNPEIVNELDKTKKSLGKILRASTGETQYHVSMLLDEVEGISQTLKHSTEGDLQHEEYRAVEKIFGYLQISTACLMAFAHGANDVANAIGPLSAAVNTLLSGSLTSLGYVPTWALALGGSGIVIGLATWGWRVIVTIGKNITELTPTRGFAAEFGTALTVLFASRLGLPISTTHTLVGAVLGVGFARGIEALNLATMRDILLSWVVTIPAGALMCVGTFYIVKFLFN
jgi:PiT family inorganic phosphate transporter